MSLDSILNTNENGTWSSLPFWLFSWKRPDLIQYATAVVLVQSLSHRYTFPMNAIIYKKTNCPWSAAVEAFLTVKKVQFETRDIYKNPEWKTEVENATGQSKSPTLNVEGEWLPDASVEQVNDLMKKIGAYR
jgi:glutaredoxin